MAASDSAESDRAEAVSLADVTTFSPEARTNAQIMATDGMVVRMNCYEPGQATPTHMHPGEDEILYVTEGAGTFRFRDAPDLPAQAGDLVRLPGDQFHSIHADRGSRMVVIYFMRPDYGSVRPDDAEETPFIPQLHGEGNLKAPGTG